MPFALFGADTNGTATMMARTVLVTGAGGYLGPSVVRALCDRGFRVLATDRKEFDCDRRAQRIAISFEAIPSDAALIRNVPDVVLHLAWSGGFQHDDPGHIESLPRHHQFLIGMLDAGVSHLAVMGTMHEIGYWEGSINEATPANPASLYGIAKNALRQAMLVQARRRGITLQWLRAFYILGEDARNRSLFSKILLWEAEGRASFPMNSGRNKYDFIAIENLSAQIAAAIAQTEVDGIINCCSGEPTELREVVEAFIARNRLKIRPAFGEYPDRPYDSPQVWGDPEKINSIMRAAGSAAA